METPNFWKYLDNIWILTGLVLVIAISLLKMLSVNNLNSRKSKQQLQKGINYLFVLGITGMALGILFSQNSNLTAPQQTKNNLLDAPSFPNQDAAHIQSPSIGIDADAGAGSADFNQRLFLMPERIRSERPKLGEQQSQHDNDIANNGDEESRH